jgi:UDP-N-acetylglucosamine 2-epimerase
MVWLMNKASCVVSDSGGIQEEAPTFGLKVFITRDTTERPEVLKEFGVLVDDDHDLIVESVREHTLRKQSLHTCNPFGDGHAAKYIVNVLMEKHSV